MKARLKLALAATVAVIALLAGGMYAWALSYWAVDYSWYDGSGSYTLTASGGNLQALANLVNGDYDPKDVKNAKTDGKPIDFAGQTVKLKKSGHPTFAQQHTMTPIGNSESHVFNGTFDGNGSSISYLFLDSADKDAGCGLQYVGVFGHVGPKGSVRNLTVNDTCTVRVLGTSAADHIAYVGGVVGRCEGSISSCTSYAQVEVKWDDGNAGEDRMADNACVINGVGGVAGYCDGDVKSCAFKGWLQVSTPANAYFIKGDQANYTDVVQYVGGVVGRSGGEPAEAGLVSKTYGNIENCSNSTNIVVMTTGAGGKDRFGETVDSKSRYVGGIAGYAIGDVTDCTNTGDITGTSYEITTKATDAEIAKRLEEADGGADSCGGIVGGYRSEGYSNAYPTQELRERGKAFKSKNGISVDRGIVGKEAEGRAHKITLSNCTNMGAIIACNNVGGICGSTGTYTTITACVNGNAAAVLADDECAAVTGTRWNKPCIGGIAGRCYGDVSYCRNHGEVGTTDIGYYVGGLVGDLYRYTDANGQRFTVPEVFASYSTGQTSCTKALRRGALLGDNGGYIHDCLFLYGTASIAEDEELVAVGYSGGSGADGVQARLTAAYSTQEQVKEHGDDAFLMKSARAVAWLNSSCPQKGWDDYWMLSSGANKGYPVLKHEGYKASAAMELTALKPSVTFLRDARFSLSWNPTPSVEVVMEVGGVKTTLVEYADYYVQPDASAVKKNGTCKGVTNGKRPYTATVVGIGNYKGVTGSVKYGIIAGDFSECTLSAASASYTGQAQNDPLVTVVDPAGGIVDASAYTYTVNDGHDCIKPKSYSVVATAVDGGNYKGHCSGTYDVSKVDIARDCDVVGVTYRDPKLGWRVWYYDDTTYQPYEVMPVLDAAGELTYFTQAELEKQGLSTNDARAYAGYPKVEGFEVYQDPNDADRTLSRAAAKPGTQPGMALDYTGADLRPGVIGVNWSQGKLDESMWKYVYGGGTGGSVVSGSDNDAVNGSKNIEAGVVGAITVAHTDNGYTANYDVISFDIMPVAVQRNDLVIEQMSTVLVLSNGTATNTPSFNIYYLGNKISENNYYVEIVRIDSVDGKDKTDDIDKLTAGDTVYYRIVFPENGSVFCTAIDSSDGKAFTCEAVSGRKDIGDASIKITIASEWNNQYSFNGITDPPIEVVDTANGKKLVLGRDYSVAYYKNKMPGNVQSTNRGPEVVIFGMDAYAGTKTEHYSIEKGVLDNSDVMAIVNGETQDAKLCVYMGSGFSDLSYCNPMFPYRVNGYSCEDFSDDGTKTNGRGLGIAWHAGASSEKAKQAHGLFLVTEIENANHVRVNKATEPGKYYLRVIANLESYDSYFESAKGLDVVVPIWIKPVDLMSESHSIDEISGMRTDAYQTGGFALLKVTLGKYEYNRTRYAYTGNPIQPQYQLMDSAGRELQLKIRESDNADELVKKYSFSKEDYLVVTHGYKRGSGPIEIGDGYVASEIVANESSNHLTGARDLRLVDGDDRNTYSIVTANLDTDVIITVDDGYYTNDGAKPKVRFFVDDEECNYVEGKDYRLEYSDNKDIGTAKVRVVVLDTNHLTASKHDEQGNPYVDVNFPVLGREVTLDNTDDVTWSLPKKLSLKNAKKGTLVASWAQASYASEDGNAQVTVTDDAYKLTCGTYDAATQVFKKKTKGWKAGEKVYFQVTSTDKYSRYQTGKGSHVIGSATVCAAGKANSLARANKKNSKLSVKLAKKKLPYTGSAPNVKVTVKNGSTKLVEGRDYTFKASTAKKPGAANVKVTGMGAYHGTCKVKYTVTKAAIKNCKLSLSAKTYTGKQIKPSKKSVALSYGGAKLPAKVLSGAKLSYGANVKAGKGSITVKAGKSKYLKGSKTFAFSITPLKLSAERFSVSQLKSKGFTGAKVELAAGDLSVTDTARSNVALKMGRDYVVSYTGDQKTIGVQGIVISGTGNYAGSLEASYKIGGLGLKDAAVELEEPPSGEWTYTGDAIEPNVTVKFGEQELVEGEDYQVVFENNVNAGTARVNVTGVGNCTGSAPVMTFPIEPRLLTNANAELDVEDAAGYLYTGQAVEPRAELRMRTAKGYAVVPKTDYIYKYAKEDGTELAGAPAEAGSYLLCAVPKSGGNYAAESRVTAPFSIKKVAFESCTAKVVGYYAFGKEAVPHVTVRTPDGTEVDAAEYTVTVLSAGTAVGDAIAVRVDSAGRNFEAGATLGTVTGAVEKAVIGKDDVSFSDGGKGVYTYTGTKVVPAVEITVDGRELVEGTDYTLVPLSDQIGPGVQSMEVVCPEKSFYTSTLVITYEVEKG